MILYHITKEKSRVFLFFNKYFLINILVKSKGGSIADTAQNTIGNIHKKFPLIDISRVKFPI